MSALGLVSVANICPVLALLSPGFSLVGALFLLHFLHTGLMLCWALPFEMDRLTSHFVFCPTMMILVAMHGVSGYQLNALLESSLEDRQVIIIFGSRPS